MNEPLRVLLGPTASGKTAVSLPLAEALDAEIVSVDSRQIYRGLEIGSAAPTRAERARVPHHLVAEVEPEAVMSAGEFGRRARAAAAEIEGRGKTALLVGGSGLYLRAALGGLDEGLPKDEAVRAKIRLRLEHEGVEALYVELARLDPESAAGISPRDAQRVMRALEIMALSGRPPASSAPRGAGPRSRPRSPSSTAPTTTSRRGSGRACSGWWRPASRTRCGRFGAAAFPPTFPP